MVLWSEKREVVLVEAKVEEMGALVVSPAPWRHWEVLSAKEPVAPQRRGVDWLTYFCCAGEELMPQVSFSLVSTALRAGTLARLVRAVLQNWVNSMGLT